MSHVDVLEFVSRRPFEPFRIEVSDGSHYEVRHPELVMVGLGAVAIGRQAPGTEDPVYERMHTVSLAHVVKLIPLGAPVTPNGQN